MKKILLLLAVAFLSVVSNAQEEYDYSLEGLAKACLNYDKVCPFHDGRAIVEKGGKYGVIDKQGNEVIPCKYNLIRDYSDGVAIVREQDDKFGVVDIQGNLIFQCKCDVMADFSDGVAFVGKNYEEKMEIKYGVIDKKGNVVTSYKYNFADTGKFNNGIAIVGNQFDNYSAWGIIDKQGNEMLPCEFKEIKISEDIAILIDRNKKYCAIDLQRKKLVVAFGDYSYIGDFNNGFATVAKRIDARTVYYGAIDKNGKEIVPCKYRYMSNFLNGYAKIENILDEKIGKGLIDTLGREIVPCIYKEVGEFSDGLVYVESKQSMGGEKKFIDKNGETAFVLNSNYCKVENFVDGLCEVRESTNGTLSSERAGFIDKSGNVIVPIKYKYVMSPSEGICAVKNEDNKWGYIDKKGNVVIPFKYLTAFSFVDGFARVEVSRNEWSIIDKKGNDYKCIYEDAKLKNFSEGLAVVKKDGRYGYIDKKGRCTFDF